MLRIFSQYKSDIDDVVERNRADGVEESFRRRYMQGNERWEIWGTTAEGKRWKAIEDPFDSEQEAREYTQQYLNEFKEEGWVELWLALEDTAGEHYENLWNKENDMI